MWSDSASRPLSAARFILMACAVIIAGTLGLSPGSARTTPVSSGTTQTMSRPASTGNLTAQTGDLRPPTGIRPPVPADLLLPALMAPRRPIGPVGPDAPASSDPSETQADPIVYDEPRPLTDEELLELEVNELGGVPIIMYHDVGDREGYLVRSRENFRKDLQRFYDLGYCLVPLSDYLTGDIRLPAGKSPLVITFDDGRASQLKLIEVDDRVVGGSPNGHPAVSADPDCAVGILLDFSRKHPGFGHAATFFVNYPRMFGTEARAREYMKYLLDNGMEIGNHTRSHRNLASASPDEVVKEIAGLAYGIRETMDYETLSLALPYGNYPKSKRNLLAGWWDELYYRNLGVLLAGAEPAPSPYSTKFNPLAIPRIHGSDSELDKWLGCLERYPERRYTSDGRSDTVAVCLDYGMEVNVDRDSELLVRTFATPVDPGVKTPLHAER